MTASGRSLGVWLALSESMGGSARVNKAIAIRYGGRGWRGLSCKQYFPSSTRCVWVGPWVPCVYFTNTVTHTQLSLCISPSTILSTDAGVFTFYRWAEREVTIAICTKLEEGTTSCGRHHRTCSTPGVPTVYIYRSQRDFRFSDSLYVATGQPHINTGIQMVGASLGSISVASA